MKTRMLDENTQSYEPLMNFHNFTKNLLENKLIKQLLIMKTNPQSISSEELDEIEQRLEQMTVRFIYILIIIDFFFIRMKLIEYNNSIYKLILPMLK
jgi:hypothetical protein